MALFAFSFSSLSASLMLLAQTVPQEAPEIIVPGPARPSAQTPATMVVEPAAMFVAACDMDGDGITTRSELQECVARSFATIDTGHTGSMRYFAFADWAQRYLGDRNALPSPFDVDKDGDDQVTLAELQTQFSKLYSRFNRDGQDGISRAELLTFKTGPIDANGPTRPGIPKKKDGKPADADKPKPDRR
ncbi:EF-hand domain-containing protein [Sphingomonas sp. Leaf339]|uniref:EF-hand domain-containing protein n=1 Tax=Sphingomonas sp. Leaf339 TaxID=1736343 RepID=UPI000ABBE2D5|nr:EF-hand domain-containing protein [Sphingomonas sp. Leaf339]